MNISKIITDNQVRVFLNFRYYIGLSVFRVMEEKGFCRVMLSQRISQNALDASFLADLPWIPILSMTVSEYHDPTQYRKEDVIAVFFRLQRRRWWLPRPMAMDLSHGESVVEWAEYRTDEYEIKFSQYNNAIVAK